MNTFAATLLLTLAGAFMASAQTARNDVTRSMSGQFLVATRAGDLRWIPPALATNSSLLRLEPQFAAVSAERIKQTVWRLIELEGSWELPIAITLQRPRSANDAVNVFRDRLGTRPCYHVNMPAAILREQYLHALVQVVLLEFAGRKAPEQPVEIPDWLLEGLTYHLLCNHSTELLLSAPIHQDNGLPLDRAFTEYRQFSPMEKAHKVLIGTTPLSFEELSWPTTGQLKGEELPRYQASAQVFLCSLLRFPDGAECLRRFLTELPKHQNWQMAFLTGFAPHFKRPLDIEKWWALEGLSFAQRDITQTWPYAQSWEKLDAVLTETVDVFVSTNQLPERSQLTLSKAVRTWNDERQIEMLERKSTELKALNLRIAPELASLTASYITTLDNYLRERKIVAPSASADRTRQKLGQRSEQQLINRLAELDTERERLRLGQDQAQSAPDIAKLPGVVAGEMRLPEFKLRAN
jgi:hypothetical protein